MLRRLIVGFLVGFLLSIAAGHGTFAQNRPLVSNVFVQSDLRQALDDVAAQAKVNIITDPSVQGVVSVTLDNVTVDKALKLLLAGTEYQVQVTPDYYLVFSADEAAGIFPSVAKTQMVSVQYIAPDTAKSLLPTPLQRYVRVDVGSGMLAVTAPGELLERIVLDLKQMDRPSGEDTVFVALDYVRAAAAKSLLPENLQRYVRTDIDRNTLAVTAPKGSREQILSQIARLDVALPAGSYDMPSVHRTKVVKLNHSKALSALNLLPIALGNYVRADEASNTLAISAPNDLLRGIMADIAAIDVPRRHIMLDARVVVLERADLLDFGAEWKLPTLTAGGMVSETINLWGLQIGFTPGREFTNALALTLNLLTQNNEATIIASPQVLAQDGIEAEIKVTTEEYFQIATAEGPYLRSDLEKIETGTILGITPQVGPNGELTLSMNIEVSDVVSRGERNLPVVSRRIARSTVQIQDGGTAAIAGLVDTRSQFGRAGVPRAERLPILGSAFRTDTLNHQARQVAVFVTATLVNQHGKKFRNGRVKNPPIVVGSDAIFVQDLEAALNQLGVSN